VKCIIVLCSHFLNKDVLLRLITCKWYTGYITLQEPVPMADCIGMH